MRSPCLTCANLDMDKDTDECLNCAARMKYLETFEPQPGCPEDPAYSMAYTVSMRSKLLRASDQISSWDLIPC